MDRPDCEETKQKAQEHFKHAECTCMIKTILNNWKHQNTTTYLNMSPEGTQGGLKMFPLLAVNGGLRVFVFGDLTFYALQRWGAAQQPAARHIAETLRWFCGNHIYRNSSSHYPLMEVVKFSSQYTGNVCWNHNVSAKKLRHLNITEKFAKTLQSVSCIHLNLYFQIEPKITKQFMCVALKWRRVLLSFYGQ